MIWGHPFQEHHDDVQLLGGPDETLGGDDAHRPYGDTLW